MNNYKSAPARRPSSTFVNGQTRLFGIIGDPISQVKSPETMTAELQARGLNAILVPIEIRPVDLPSTFPALLCIQNLHGLVVTMPHKHAVAPFLAGLGPRAKAANAASILARTADGYWVGELLDGAGCCAAIENRGVSLDGSTVQLLGAGGAGSAIAVELLARRPEALRIFDPNPVLLDKLLVRLSALARNTRLETGFGPSDILINASPIGMNSPNDSPVSEADLSSYFVVMDCVLEPEPTRLLSLATAAGALAISGREMLDSQIDAACDFFAYVNATPAAELTFLP